VTDRTKASIRVEFDDGRGLFDLNWTEVREFFDHLVAALVAVAPPGVDCSPIPVRLRHSSVEAVVEGRGVTPSVRALQLGPTEDWGARQFDQVERLGKWRERQGAQISVRTNKKPWVQWKEPDLAALTFTELTSADAIVQRVGGKDQRVSLEFDLPAFVGDPNRNRRVFTCETAGKVLTVQLGALLYERVRVQGTAKRLRHPHSVRSRLLAFTIENFEVSPEGPRREWTREDAATTFGDSTFDEIMERIG